MPQISNDNMYTAGYGLVVDDTPYLVRERLSIKPQIGDRWHTVTEGDRLELLAWRYYTQYTIDAKNYWWLLADANNIANPFSINSYVGRYFLIPDFFRMQRLIDEYRGDALRIRRFGDSVKSYEQEDVYTEGAITPSPSIGSGGNGDIIPDLGNPVTPTNPTNPVCAPPKKIHLFFEMQNNGGYKIANLDIDGHIQYYEANPNDYCNSLIVEQPGGVINTPIMLNTVTPIVMNDDNSFSVSDDGEIMIDQ